MIPLWNGEKQTQGHRTLRCNWCRNMKLRCKNYFPMMYVKCNRWNNRCYTYGWHSPSPSVDELSLSGGIIKFIRGAGKHWPFLYKVWKKDRKPEDWKENVIIPLIEQGDRKKLSNYRGITLTTQVGKMYEIIVKQKVRPLVELNLLEEQ